MKLGVESVKKLLETADAYARWSEALRLGSFEEAKRWKEAWIEMLNNLTVDEFLVYLEADI